MPRHVPRSHALPGPPPKVLEVRGPGGHLARPGFPGSLLNRFSVASSSRRPMKGKSLHLAAAPAPGSPLRPSPSPGIHPIPRLNRGARSCRGCRRGAASPAPVPSSPARARRFRLEPDPEEARVEFGYGLDGGGLRFSQSDRRTFRAVPAAFAPLLQKVGQDCVRRTICRIRSPWCCGRRNGSRCVREALQVVDVALFHQPLRATASRRPMTPPTHGAAP